MLHFAGRTFSDEDQAWRWVERLSASDLARLVDVLGLSVDPADPDDSCRQVELALEDALDEAAILAG